MLTEKLTMRTETVFSDDRLNRYLLRKEWDSKKSQSHNHNDKSNVVIIAWVKLGENNKKVQQVESSILTLLLPYKDKLRYIASEKGDYSFHHAEYKSLHLPIPEEVKRKVSEITIMLDEQFGANSDVKEE